MKLHVQAPGKVNLCLFLGPVRGDGRHQLVTLVESVSLADELLVAAREDGPDEVRCAAIPEPNLVSLALQGLRARGWDGPPLTVEITKRLPVGGGMGGGSADAAALLRAAQELRALPVATVAQLAAELGADVPGQLEPGPALATGAGERVERVAPLAPHAFAIVPQPYPLSTREVYAEADRLALGHDLDELRETLEHVRASMQERLPDELLVNELEPATLSLRPHVGGALAALRASGADRALVSGSGPTVFGLFWGDDAAARAEAAAASLAERYPGATAAVPIGPQAGRPRELA